MVLASTSAKNQRIKQSLAETRRRRNNQTSKVFGLKLDDSHFNRETRERMRRLFLEAKWM